MLHGHLVAISLSRILPVRPNPTLPQAPLGSHPYSNNAERLASCTDEVASPKVHSQSRAGVFTGSQRLTIFRMHNPVWACRASPVDELKRKEEMTCVTLLH